MNKILLIQILNRIRENKVHLFSASFSYLILLAIIPSISLTLNIFNLLVKAFPVLTNPVIPQIKEVLDVLNISPTLSVVFYLVSLNLLSQGFESLLLNNEEIFNTKARSFVARKAYSFFLSLLFIIIILTISIVFVLLTIPALQEISILINYIFVFLILFLFYRLTSRIPFKKLLMGTIVASFLISFLSYFYSLFVSRFTTLENRYGLFSPIIISLIYLYYLSFIIYIGIIVNSQLLKVGKIKIHNRKKISKAGLPMPK